MTNVRQLLLHHRFLNDVDLRHKKAGNNTNRNFRILDKTRGNSMFDTYIKILTPRLCAENCKFSKSPLSRYTVNKPKYGSLAEILEAMLEF